MLLGKNSRHFVRYEFSLQTPRRSGPAIPLIGTKDELDVTSLLEKAIADKTAAYELREHDVVRVTKCEIREKDGLAVFLVRRRDEAAATQVFEHGDTGALWKPDVGPKQAPALSAHLFVRLAPIAGPNVKHRAIMEEVPGLGRTYLQFVINKVLRTFEYEYEDKKGKPKTSYTMLRLAGIPSESLAEALKGGAIKYVELVRDAQVDGLDMAGLIPHPQRMRLSLKNEKNPLDIVGRVKEWALARDWKNVRVQVETADDRTKVVELSREADAADILFVRSEVVETKDQLEVCTDEINGELVTLAAARFKSDENW